MRLVDEFEKMFQSYTYLDFNARRPNGAVTVPTKHPSNKS
jgi:hypothetical protein